jgi:hypothetical protein
MARLSGAAASAAADAVAGLMGRLRIYAGSRPPTADTPASPQTMLAELTFSIPAFGPALDGMALALPITADLSATATGTAAWFRITDASGSAICDGTVGTRDADLILNTTAIVAGAEVRITTLTYTQAAA